MLRKGSKDEEVYGVGIINDENEDEDKVWNQHY